MPVVQARPELFDAYAAAFRAELAAVGHLEAAELSAALALVADGPGGYLNQHRYHRELFSTFFEGRDWRWPELDRWQAIGAARGRWPIRWSTVDRISMEAATASGREVLASKQWSTYVLLTRHIAGRARTIDQLVRLATLGVTQWTLKIGNPQDQEFFDLALSTRPDAVPPLFPTDASILQPTLPGLS